MKKHLILLLTAAGLFHAVAPAQVTFPSLNSSPWLGQELLGRIESNSVTVNVAFDKNMQVFVEYGTVSGVYSKNTDTQTAQANTPLNILLANLQPNTRYYYRVQYATAGSTAFTPRAEHSFVTQRPRGTPFTFVIQSDPHMDANSAADVYQQTLLNQLADRPDFMIDLGDTMLTDKLDAQGVPVNGGSSPNLAGILTRAQMFRSYYDVAAHSVPLFLALGNHEGEWGSRLNGTANNFAIWDTQVRNAYFPNPAPDSFFSGDTSTYDLNGNPCASSQTCAVGQRRSYYAWEWGDALFVVLDPYWSQTPNATIGQSGNGKDCCQNGQGYWSLTLGTQQYNWLKQTLETSTAKYKFVFSHNLVGGVNPNVSGVDQGPMRGGVEAAKYLEWGGYNLDGTWGFATYRPSMAMPIHQLLVANHVTAFFHGHDHLYAHQTLDGVTYQEIPQPSAKNTNLGTRASDYGYTQGTLLGGRGYLRVQVAPSGVKVEYVETWLPSDGTSRGPAPPNGTIADSYTMTAATCAPPVLNAGGQAFSAPGGTGTITVTAAAGCPWSIDGLPSWVTLTSPASGTGSGTVTFTVAANNGGSLSGSFTVGGTTFAIRQQAANVAGLTLTGSMPHVAAEGGWSTTFTFVNKGSSSAVARTRFLNPDGTSLKLPVSLPQQPSINGPLLASSLDETIAPNASLVMQALGPASVPYLEGSAQLESTGNVDGFAIFHYDPSNQEAVVPLETRTAPEYVLAFDNTNSVVTGIALGNVANAAANVPVIIRDDAGAQVLTGQISLSAGGHTSFVLPLRYPQTANMRGTITFQTPAGGRVSALAIRFTGLTTTTIPALANVGTGGGRMAHLAVGSGWQTTLVLVNTGASAASATVSTYDDNGNALPLPLTFSQGGATETSAAFTRSLAPGASLWVQSSGANGTPLLTGSAQLSTTGNVGGFVIFRYNPNGQEASVPLEDRNAGAYLIAYDNTAAIATGIAISNASSSAITVPAVVRDDAGATLGTGTIALAANGHAGFVMATEFPQSANRRGTIEFDAPSGSAISVLGVRTPPVLTFTTLPALTTVATPPGVFQTSVPGAPVSVAAIAGSTIATISFLPPVSNGGSAITTYTATCTAGSASVTGIAAGSPILVTGLTNGTAYTCTVTAANAVGVGPASGPAIVTPSGPSSGGSFTLSSSAATNGGVLPATYTCDGFGSTLPLAWSNPPAGTVEYALLMSTIPTPGTIKYNWVLYNIPATVTSLAQDSFLVGNIGVGDDGPGTIYNPPCSQGPGAKLYTYTLFALSAAPALPGAANQVTGAMVSSAISSLTLASASLNLNYSRNPATAPGSTTNCVYIRNSLSAGAKSGGAYAGCDGTYAYISSIAVTGDPTMNGITSTNLQVPTAQNFQGANGWKIPLNPALAPSPTAISSGPLGVAVNGIPIFNPCVQQGCTASSGDTKALGQLDTCNGHAGRSDDYHYHAAPVCMMAWQPANYWNTHPVGWALDGFAIFGYNNADGSVASRDSACGGNTSPVQNAPSGYSYHLTDAFPYITNNNLCGVPSPDLPNQGSKFRPLRQPPVTPFNDTNMTLTTANDGYQVLQFTSPTAFTTTETGSDSYSNPPGTYKIRYIQLKGAELAAQLALSKNAGKTACWRFEFQDASGSTTQPAVAYCR